MKFKVYLIIAAILCLSSCEKKGKEQNIDEGLILKNIEKQLTLSKSLNSTDKKKYIDSSLYLISKAKNSQKTRDILSKIIYEYY